MIRIELKPVCMDCDHADVEVEEEVFCGFAAGRRSTVVRCAHAAVCGAAAGAAGACQRPANGAGGDGGPGDGEPPRRRPITGPFALGM